MSADIYDRIKKNPKFTELVNKRSGYAWMLTFIVLILFYGFILLVAFNKEFLAQKTGAGVMSIGIPIGVGVILFTIIITGIYIRRANTEFDDLKAQVIKEATK